MNKLISLIITMAVGLFISLNTVAAEERVKTFELAESGIAVEFPAVAPELQDTEIAPKSSEGAAFR